MSTWTFGSHEFCAGDRPAGHRRLLRAVTDGQAALIQGMRRIGDLAAMSVVAAVFGSTVTLSADLASWSQRIVPSLVAVAAITLGDRLVLSIAGLHAQAVIDRTTADRGRPLL